MIGVRQDRSGNLLHLGDSLLPLVGRCGSLLPLVGRCGSLLPLEGRCPVLPAAGLVVPQAAVGSSSTRERWQLPPGYGNNPLETN